MFNSKIRDARTYYNKRHIGNIRIKLYNYDKDSDKLVRQENMICKHCYYIMTDRIAGQTFTTLNCNSCNKEMSFPTTDTDDLCMQCAKELNCCKHCGQKMD